MTYDIYVNDTYWLGQVRKYRSRWEWSTKPGIWQGQCKAKYSAVQALLTHHENAYHRAKSVWRMIQVCEITQEVHK